MVGWIKLHRKLQENDLWLSEPFSRGQAWVDLLLLCNHKPSFIRARGIKVSIDRGQCGWSQVKLAERWKWSRGKVIRFLDELETVQQIVQEKNNVTSLITIVNYCDYQSDDTADDTANGQQIEQQTDSKRYTNKNDKNVKNVNNTPIPPKGASHSLKILQKIFVEIFHKPAPDLSEHNRILNHFESDASEKAMQWFIDNPEHRDFFPIADPRKFEATLARLIVKSNSETESLPNYGCSL